ncbi:MAG: RteC domain-containing protein [Rikenellaceae bacterium]
MKYSLERIAEKAAAILPIDCNVWEIELSIPELKNKIKNLEELLAETKSVVYSTEMDVDAEIYCFKVVKPQILGRILFLKDVILIKSEEVLGMVEFNKSNLNFMSQEIEKFIDSHKPFVRYMRAEETKFDSQYFTRESAELKSCTHAYYCGCLTKFATAFDMECAQLYRYDLLSKFIAYRHQILEASDDMLLGISSAPPNLTWTKNETDLVELIYGLFAVGAFNRGTVDVKEIAELFERSFNFKIKDCYKTYRYCRSRKKDRVPFLNATVKALLEKMDSNDK